MPGCLKSPHEFRNQYTGWFNAVDLIVIKSLIYEQWPKLYYVIYNTCFFFIDFLHMELNAANIGHSLKFVENIFFAGILKMRWDFWISSSKNIWLLVLIFLKPQKIKRWLQNPKLMETHQIYKFVSLISQGDN